MTVTTSTRPAAPPAVVGVDVVPATCTAAIADARQMALLAVNGFSQFSQYAKLASQAIPAAIAHNSSKMAAIRQADRMHFCNSLTKRANEIARLGDEVSAAADQCG